MPSGGYRRPSNPAPVSNPGAGSARTDGGPKNVTLDNAKYGENKQFQDIQRGAALAPAAGPAGAPQGGGAPAATPTAPTAMGDPSTMPDQPVTAGADAGMGPGSSELGLPDTTDSTAELKRKYGPLLPFLIRKADDPTSSQAFRDQVRTLISQIG